MRILLKFPTRGRPARFLQTLKEWLDAAADPSRLAILVSYDADDATMTPEVIAAAEKLHPACVCVKGNSKTKIEACNADLNEYGGDWNVCLLCSDDMWVRRRGWDDAIRQNMQKYFPDTDGALWHFDQAQRKINTLECVGRKYYERRRYLYHPTYASFFSDNESTAVGLRDKRLVFIEEGICSHEQPHWCGGMKRDATYMRNNKYWGADSANFARRQAEGFPP